MFEHSLVVPGPNHPEAKSYRVNNKYPFSIEIHKRFCLVFLESHSMTFSRSHDINCVYERRPERGVRATGMKYKVPSPEKADESHLLHTVLDEKIRCFPTSTLPDDYIVFDPVLLKVMLRELKPGDNVFHDCVNEQCGKGYSGVPSAFITAARIDGDHKFLQCHACSTSYAIIPVYKPEPYRCTQAVPSWSLVEFSSS